MLPIKNTGCDAEPSLAQAARAQTSKSNITLLAAAAFVVGCCASQGLAAQALVSGPEADEIGEALAQIKMVELVVAAPQGNERTFLQDLSPIVNCLQSANIHVSNQQVDAVVELKLEVDGDQNGDCLHSLSLATTARTGATNGKLLVKFTRSGYRRCDDVPAFVERDALLLCDEFRSARSHDYGPRFVEHTRDESVWLNGDQATATGAPGALNTAASGTAQSGSMSQSSLSALREAAYQIGCALGGGNCAAGADTGGPAVSTASTGCTSDFQCGLGQVCVKPAGSFRVAGRCAAPVDKFGVRDFGVQKSGWGAREVRSCQSSVDCPIGFRCSKDAYQLAGICARN